MKSLFVLLVFASFMSFDFLEADNPESEAAEQIQATEKASEKKILFFTATWCPPCQSFKKNELPKISKLGLDIKVYDVDESPEIYRKWKKTDKYIPLFVFIGDDGEEYSRVSGYQTSGAILKIWDSE